MMRTNYARKLACFVAVAGSLMVGVPRLGHAQERAWTQLMEQVETLYKQKQFAAAAATAEEALTMAERTFGPDHPHVAASLNKLVIMYRSLASESQAKYVRSEALYQRALAILEQT